MSENTPEPEIVTVVTDDSIPDGTQLPDNDGSEKVVEEGDAGVNDTGDEPWYEEGDA